MLEEPIVNLKLESANRLGSITYEYQAGVETARLKS